MHQYARVPSFPLCDLYSQTEGEGSPLRPKATMVAVQKDKKFCIWSSSNRNILKMMSVCCRN